MKTTWKICNLDRRLSDGFVFTAYWSVSMEDNNLIASANGTCLFNGVLTIPYNELSEQTVLNWIWEIVNKESIEQNLKIEIEKQINPTETTGLPW